MTKTTSRHLLDILADVPILAIAAAFVDYNIVKCYPYLGYFFSPVSSPSSI